MSRNSEHYFRPQTADRDRRDFRSQAAERDRRDRSHRHERTQHPARQPTREDAVPRRGSDFGFDWPDLSLPSWVSEPFGRSGAAKRGATPPQAAPIASPLTRDERRSCIEHDLAVLATRVHDMQGLLVRLDDELEVGIQGRRDFL